ncbi:hypothetical protein Patl1_02627 [Pistacia atlantica]|uniref:Uncharacterized protein n=1 Tax=Pistacia atlantica TaxID=434234 RepID=A0ACC1C9R9_9ROSI|nr:hypothetical protein Patl1_02627 [Pistacia atlantica]
MLYFCIGYKFAEESTLNWWENSQIFIIKKRSCYLRFAIPDLCWELAQLQDTYILQGDYDLKVMRQEFYINRQKAFINHLINQLARHQFLKIACLLEKKTMLGAYSLLKVIESELQGYLSATRGRVAGLWGRYYVPNANCKPTRTESNVLHALIFVSKVGLVGQGNVIGWMFYLGRCLALIEAASDVQEQGAVDDRDTFLHGVRDLLSIHSNAQGGLSTYVSAPGIVQQISALHSDLMTLQSDLENSLPGDRNRCINELCTLIQSLQQLLFASSTTAQPILTPRRHVWSHPLYKSHNLLDSWLWHLLPHQLGPIGVTVLKREYPERVVHALINVYTAFFSFLVFIICSNVIHTVLLKLPKPLMKELDEMEKINTKLSVAVEEVTLEHCKKNEIIKHHSQEVGLQRRVFVDFFCNPERLRSQVRELTARVRALQVS